MFIDETVLTVTSGAGGRGCESFHSRPDRKRIADGGDGGRGSDIVFRADENVTSLEGLLYQKTVTAKAGGPGGRNRMAGRSAGPEILRVPCGTTIYNHETGLRIRDLIYHGDEVVAVEGGAGGRGNQHGKETKPAGLAVTRTIRLVVKMVCDVVLLGMPNSGKSSLLAQLTNAKPKVEPYAFTTRTPQLGTMESEAFEQVRLCELPGLLEKAADGKGMGNAFLRHAERARLILLVLDPVNEFGWTPKQSYEILLNEMKQFNPALLDVRRFLVMNKMDQPGIKKVSSDARAFRDETMFFVSTVTGEGIDQLKKAVWKVLSV